MNGLKHFTVALLFVEAIMAKPLYPSSILMEVTAQFDLSHMGQTGCWLS